MISIVLEQQTTSDDLKRTAGTGLAAYGAYKLYQHPTVQKGLEAAKKGADVAKKEMEKSA